LARQIEEFIREEHDKFLKRDALDPNPREMDNSYDSSEKVPADGSNSIIIQAENMRLFAELCEFRQRIWPLFLCGWVRA